MSPTLGKSPLGASAGANLKQHEHARPHQHQHQLQPQDQDQDKARSEPIGRSSSECENKEQTGEDAFARLLAELERAFGRSDSAVDVDELWHLLADYKSRPAEWQQFAFYDAHKYKRNLVADFDKFNVMIICWAPGSQSCIHDHSGSHCFMKILDGELLESRFAWPDASSIAGVASREMARLSETRMPTDDVVYINDKVGLHLVANPNPNKTAASLHVYIPPYRKCKAFDQRTGRAQNCEMKFYSERGRVISTADE